MLHAFSSRLIWNQRANPLSRLLEQKRQLGESILDLTESNPTRAGFAYSAEILEAISDERGLRYDPSPLGLLESRDAVANYYREHGANVPPSRILVTASTSEAYAYLFKLLADPGDEILAPRPSYPLFEFLAGLESVRIRQYPLRYDGMWHLDFEALQQAISKHTRAIVIVNPNNPTGSFLKYRERERLESIASQYDLAILSDEVFCDYGFGINADRVLTMADSSKALTFSMSGLSKIAGLPQMKLGWIVANGPGAEEALEALELIADTYLSVGTPIQVALPKLIQSNAVADQIRVRTASNLKHLREAFRGSAATVLDPEGGWYTIIRVPRTHSEEDWAMILLRDQNVLVQPGFFFDFETEAFLVISLLTPAEIFAEGVNRIRRLI